MKNPVYLKVSKRLLDLVISEDCTTIPNPVYPAIKINRVQTITKQLANSISENFKEVII